MKQSFAYLLVVLFALQGCTKKESIEEKVRIVIPFNTEWKSILGDNPRASIEAFDDTSWRMIDLTDRGTKSDYSTNSPTIPGDITLPERISWYRKTFTPNTAHEEKQTYLDVDCTCCNRSVWINGQLIDDLPKSKEYISYGYDLTPYLKYRQQNTIAIRVDNSIQTDSHHNSGLGVRLVIVDPLHIAHWSTYVESVDLSKESTEVNLQVTLQNNSKEERTAELISMIKDEEGKSMANVSCQISALKEERIKTTQAMTLENPIQWSDTHPYMYSITTQVVENGVVIDEYETPLNIRFFIK